MTAGNKMSPDLCVKGGGEGACDTVSSTDACHVATCCTADVYRSLLWKLASVLFTLHLPPIL